MLVSQKEERGRRFSLALRAGIPVLLLVFLVFYTTIDKSDTITISLEDGVLLAAITFIAIYFIYFLINLSVQETMIDQTTQGFNKQSFIKQLEYYKPKILVCINIENLQTLNENYSAEQVDVFLYTLTQQINLFFKQHGFQKILIGRNRGSEFLIAINKTTTNTQSLLQTFIKENKNISQIEVDYKFSIITDIHQDFEKNLIQLRDIINSQSIGQTNEKEINIKDAKELSTIENCVIQSIQQKNLLLSFRPLLNTHTDSVDIYEIAVKLKSAQGSDILPRIFLPIVNRLGLGREYDNMLVNHIINLLPLVDKGISFTFNLSPFSLRDESFQNKVFKAIEISGIDAPRLIIQLYERKTHHDLSGYLKTLKLFRSHGMRICIDNFGSSNASMEYMKHFKFDMVQFDRDYVTHLDEDTNYAMLNSLIKMSKDLQVQTVAKWVDNDEQKKKLRVLGINYIQGFGVGKPLSESALINRYN